MRDIAPPDRSGGVAVQNLPGPSYEINHALTSRLAHEPELKVLGPVVIAYAVDVVDVFARQKRTAERFLHDYSVFGHPATNLRRMIGALDNNVAVAVELAGDIQSPKGDVRRTVSLDAIPVFRAVARSVRRTLAIGRFAFRAVRPAAVPVDVMLAAHIVGYYDHRFASRNAAILITHTGILSRIERLWW